MIWFFRLFFIGVIVSMLTVTVWAGHSLPLWDILEAWKLPAPAGIHPWFVATLFDAYFAFTTFFFWVAYKESCWWRSILWLVLIYLLGNIAMASYMLVVLFRLPSNANMADILLRKTPKSGA